MKGVEPMVILYVLLACYLLRVVPNSCKPFLGAVWGCCFTGFFLMINGVITVNNFLLVKYMTLIAIGGIGVIAYDYVNEKHYNERKAILLKRWKHEVTLKNAA